MNILQLTTRILAVALIATMTLSFGEDREEQNPPAVNPIKFLAPEIDAADNEKIQEEWRRLLDDLKKAKKDEDRRALIDAINEKAKQIKSSSLIKENTIQKVKRQLTERQKEHQKVKEEWEALQAELKNAKSEEEKRAIIEAIKKKGEQVLGLSYKNIETINQRKKELEELIKQRNTFDNIKDKRLQSKSSKETKKEREDFIKGLKEKIDAGELSREQANEIVKERFQSIKEQRQERLKQIKERRVEAKKEQQKIAKAKRETAVKKAPKAEKKPDVEKIEKPVELDRPEF